MWADVARAGVDCAGDLPFSSRQAGPRSYAIHPVGVARLTWRRWAFRLGCHRSASSAVDWQPRGMEGGHPRTHHCRYSAQSDGLAFSADDLGLEDDRGSDGGEDLVEGTGLRGALADYETRTRLAHEPGTRYSRDSNGTARAGPDDVGQHGTGRSDCAAIPRLSLQASSRFKAILKHMNYGRLKGVQPMLLLLTSFYASCSWSGEETHTAPSLYVHTGPNRRREAI